MWVVRGGWGSVAIAVTVLLAAGSVLAWGSSRSDQATLQPAGGVIAFSVFSSQQHGIDVVSAAGGGLRQLAVNTDNAPVWSPDGTELAFAKDAPDGCNGCTDIYVMSADGSDQRQVTASGTSGSPAWSPIGNVIGFDRCKNVINGPCGIYSVAPDGSGLQRLSPLGLGDLGPVWSPNGSEIAFASLSPSGIYVMSADGSDLHRLTKGNDSFPVWSPDGTEIAFTREIPLPGRNERDDIYVVRPDGTNLRLLTHSGLDNEEPAWSPNGQLIAFVGARKSHSALCDNTAIDLITPNGSDRRRITPYAPVYNDPTWSPDGTHIAFTSARNCLQDETQPLYVMPASGGQPLLLASHPSPEDGTSLAWQPAPSAP
jgi:Tol biopolymer transport system component